MATLAERMKGTMEEESPTSGGEELRVLLVVPA